MPDSQIFKATYSGIPVYEMMCKGVAVMRRRSDSWLNATQILKVAGFDKPQRTRILEREVQKGEHEKVQGGYGKYQGTWIPLERGLAIAKQYNCEHLLRSIIDFIPADQSPPPAPKHLVAATAATKASKRDPPGGISTRSSRRVAEDGMDDETEPTASVIASEDASMTPSPSEASSSSRTPSPITSPPSSRRGGNVRGGRRSISPAGRKGKERQSRESAYDPNGGDEDMQNYGDQILEYFISDSNQVPQILVNPPPDFDPNIAIDDDCHTPLHWAAAMGRIRIVKLLLTAGADIFKVNKAGQTALMRSVMFANNYDVRKFPELYELLHRSTLNIDNQNRTLFHHIVDLAMTKSKAHAARYYLETVLGRLADYPKELADVINFQDEEGETALTMAARCRSKRLVKLLIDNGANPKIVNNEGRSAEDYIMEDERFRQSPGPPSRLTSMSFRNAQAAYGTYPSYLAQTSGYANGDTPPLHYSVAGQKAATRCVNDMASMLASLASSFDQELKEKDKDTAQAHALLGNIQAEILESQRTVNHLKSQAATLQQSKDRVKDLEEELLGKMGRRYRLGWEKWVKDEEEREKRMLEAAGGSLVDPVVVLPPGSEPEEPIPGGEPSADKGKRKAEPQVEDVSDLIALHADIPKDPEALRQACDKLKEEIMAQRKRRKVAFEEIVRYQGDAGTQGKMAEYRRLIGAGLGVPAGEVDNVVGVLLEALESDEPMGLSSSNPWGSVGGFTTKAGPPSSAGG
ncbi:transcription factor [Punctularia strigosozonata HHB-11173 SS5]|uniref:transcription factor n=1 Tax=Punctularia strigosozonata (strain HHB-11173) TaxID=741275 RepID=UPI0004416EA3|nr:transcription factor [Punctularia strigosozonata HHB-11173 SS5]EIN10385.1 transcription factor [Punctularia strigosozonata HHB-11173 SS5]